MSVKSHLAVKGPLTPRYTNDATLFEDDDGQTYLYTSGNGLGQAKIDLNTGNLAAPIEKFLDKKQPIEPVPYRDGLFHIHPPTWTEQVVEY